jgi:hypothetical protein
MIRSRSRWLAPTIGIVSGAVVVAVVGLVVLRGLYQMWDPTVLDEQTVSGVMRLTDDSFGLLIYPCTQVEIGVVEVGTLNLETRQFSPILRVTFDPPVEPRNVVISTDPDFVSQGVEREILDAELLDRINTDETYLANWDVHDLPDAVLEIVARAPNSKEDRAGSADVALDSRFDLEVDEVTVYYGKPLAIDEIECLRPRRRAWDATVV